MKKDFSKAERIDYGKQYEKEKYIVEKQSSLLPEDFANWDEGNIINNKFATENTDYICFDISVDSAVKGQTKTDYKITSDFAKKLSMTGNTERHEQARQYFIVCEQGQ